MGATTPAFNSVVRPITISEFREAILATCKPRFPHVRLARPRPIGLAISGGVDSMALAYLFSHYIKTYKAQHIADNPVQDVFAATVDHRLRPESAAEAAEVASNLRRLGLRAFVFPINWSYVLGHDVDPSKQANVESIARTLRYRVIGSFFSTHEVTSLFFAHHRDDQYETILMRLLSGHGYRGLQGINKANSIPECYDMHRAYKSGLVDDQMRPHPFLKFSPAGREMRALRSRLRLESTLPGFEQFRSHLGINDLSARFPGQLQREYDAGIPYLPPLSVEDGGITVYRPLLEFDKARLIATCEANNVPWFEDRTNTDATLTTRNTLRNICKVNELPRALQKPSILALAARSRRRVQCEENEASRIIHRQVAIVDFDPNVGSLLVDLPLLYIGREMRGRLNQPARDEARRVRQRLLAAIITRKMISLVTPDNHLPSISNLGNTVRRLFPYLYSNGTSVLDRADRKAFSMAGVQFEPIPSYKSTRWFLSRAPFSSNFLRAVTTTPERTIQRPNWGSNSHPLPWEAPRDPAWKTWKTSLLWDGRFWIRLNSCDRKKGLHVLPLMARHTKAFKAALDSRERARFEKLLKYHAPGKVRYTLPGIYAVERLHKSQEGSEESERKMMLLALPTLGVQIAGLEQWVRYDVHYRNIDMQLLGKRKCSKTPNMNGFTARISISRKKRQQRMRKVVG
ncbi:hypothetical protein BB8028_0001g05150 [Beauveria bassiana]|uniref:tRNA(Ile)-lysidine synthetase n=1 Tax=Beauveria bassiana TaxID=176275 RepID=A0A2S7XX13_BEABA|nr:hypothetical protein BB8028_0001g05150 [Beauveria bassiana]